MTAPRRARRVAHLSRLLFAAPLLVGLSTAPALAQCPVAASCTPGAASDPNAQFFNMGIYQVTLGSINNTSQGYTEGYRDVSCTVGTTLTAGANYSMLVRTGSLAPENVRVWIDWDNNGILNATSELFFSSNNALAHTGNNLAVPATAVLNTPLRMRVSADASTSPVPTPCSTPQFSQVEDYAVTVQGNTQPPIAGFTAGGDTLTCSGLVQFTDQSTNAPATWRWRFGDGQTSTQQNPQHQYAAQGQYTVSLTVTNANGTDSLRRVNYIRYDNVVPVAASCTPQTAAYCCGYGISRVRFASIDRTSANGSAGYEDFTCGSRATVYPGNNYTLTITPSGTIATDIRAWLDLNNDGQFSSSELVMTALAQTGDATVQLTVPSTITLDQPMRLRIIADAVGQPSGPCVNPQLGQAEDYTVIARANTQPPVVDFSLAQPSVCDTTIQFTDLSQNSPTSWMWYFGDGQTSTQQNPVHTYRTTGTYTVTLVARNTFGSDSVVRPNAVTITVPCIIYCEPVNLQTQSVWIDHVQLANVDRTSQLDPGGYINTGLVANLTQGIAETLTVGVTITGGGGGPPQYVASAWIDWNHNGIWETTERVLQGQGNPQTPQVQAAINVPTTAQVGVTRMRVLATRNQQLANNPCPPDGAPGLEVEDYNISIAPSQAPPVAGFSVSPRITCDGLVQLTDSSGNSPASWRWDFGDGSPISTLQNPQHQFPTTGAATYTVKLTVTNQFGRDSITRRNIVRVTGYPQPIAPTCRPNSTNPGFGLGIGLVRLTSANVVMSNNSNNGSDGYKDYSCTKQTNIYRNAPATLLITTIQGTPANMRAWLDYNNDGQFDEATETVLSINRQQGGGAGPYTTTFTVPSSASVINTRLRLRIASDWSQNPAPTPCSQPQYGQVEDYSVQIRDTVLATPDSFVPAALSLAPNPSADGRVMLRLTGNVPGADGALLTVTVRSVLGQVVARRTLTVREAQETELDLSALPRGVYIVNTNGPTAALNGNLRLVRD